MSSATAQQQHTYLVDEETIRSLYTEFEAAFRKGDLDGMLSSYRTVRSSPGIRSR